MIHDDLQALVDEQAEDEALWSVPFDRLQPIGEAYLQHELRRLHAAIEARTATRIIGDHWCEVAASRMRAGEAEAAVMKDYGYVRDNTNGISYGPNKTGKG